MDIYDLIIIGAGPAGLTAALYAGRSGLNTLLLEKMAVGGRILTSETIENYPGFPGGISTQELMQRMADQLKDLPVKVENDHVTDIDTENKAVKTASSEYRAKAIIIATGAVARKLNVPGEEKFTGRGVSYCAICDAPFFKGKKVIVVGGGNTVAEEALYLARFAAQVLIVHRRDQMRASDILQRRLKGNEKISFNLSSVIEEINGNIKVE
jgi:thioredoxin reductase (NADPH)